MKEHEEDQDLSRMRTGEGAPGGEQHAESATGNARSDAPKRWTEVLCQRCGGNGTIRLHHGVALCPRCHGHCYEPDFEPTCIVPESSVVTSQEPASTFGHACWDHHRAIHYEQPPCPFCTLRASLITLRDQWRTKAGYMQTGSACWAIKSCVDELDALLRDTPPENT